MRIQGSPPPAPQKPPAQPEAPKPPEDKDPKDQVGQSHDVSGAARWGKLALNVVYGAGIGYVAGKYIDSNRATAVKVNMAVTAGEWALGGALLGGIGTGLVTQSGKGALAGAAVGAVGGGAIGAGLGYIDGNLNYLLNHALPWSPGINGAVLGATGAVVGGLIDLARSHKPADEHK